MNERPVLCEPPASSRVRALLPGAYFHDCWQVRAAVPGLDAMDYALRAFGQVPGWVAAAMSLRNRIVRRLGLKDLGAFDHDLGRAASTPRRPGDRVGIFTLFEESPDEVLMGDRDKHLDVTVSVHREFVPGDGPSAHPATLVSVTTVVREHNLLGRLYMLPVRPMHHLIAPAVLRTLARPSPPQDGPGAPQSPIAGA